MRFYISAFLAEQIKYKTEEMFDDFHEDIASHYPSCEQFIDEGRKEGTVLVHW